jgi:predicted nucleic acid-binding protein
VARIEPSGITLVDANVLFDVLSFDAQWRDWSRAALDAARGWGDVAINPLIFAEVCAGMASYEDAEAALAPELIRREALPWDAAFLAGKAFTAHRRRGDSRRSPLPDFYIGAHAAVAGHRLLTRDAARYRSYFPTVELVAPS